MEYTGNKTVDEMIGKQISGNVIPMQWYNPIEVRDEKTGGITGDKKKFASDKLQRSYQQIADMFGISKRETTNAIVFLEKLGVIK